ncbi:hypothetical protein HGA64_02205 [Candidatus Falkowbacteria bacterium]|nr:hypothetical protein [Candidatus Falkowbacteria bacterium]
MAIRKTKKSFAQSNTDVKENRKIAALSYVFILCLVPLLLKQHSKFAQFHAKQGLVIFVLDVAAGIVSLIPLFGPVIFFCAVALSVVAFLRALKGESWEIPLIYEWSKRVTVN